MEHQVILILVVVAVDIMLLVAVYRQALGQDQIHMLLIIQMDTILMNMLKVLD